MVLSSGSERLPARSDATSRTPRTPDSAVLVALGAALLGLLWLTEVLGDPTDGWLFYTLIFSAPLLVAIGLILFASRKELVGNLALVGSILTLLGALFPDIVGFLLAIVGLALLLADVRGPARCLRIGLSVLLAGVIGLAARLEHGDGLALFLPIMVVGAAAISLTLRRSQLRLPRGREALEP